MFNRWRRRHNSATRCQPARSSRTRPQTLPLQPRWRSNHVCCTRSAQRVVACNPSRIHRRSHNTRLKRSRQSFSLCIHVGRRRSHRRIEPAHRRIRPCRCRKRNRWHGRINRKIRRPRTFGQFQIRRYDQLRSSPIFRSYRQRLGMGRRRGGSSLRASRRVSRLSRGAAPRTRVRFRRRVVDSPGSPVRRLVHVRPRSRCPSLRKPPGDTQHDHVPQQRLLKRLPWQFGGNKNVVPERAGRRCALERRKRAAREYVR
jgi:hypothetical protein